MMSYQTYQDANYWLQENKHQERLEYQPSQVERRGSTGIRNLIAEKLSSCGSGSLCDTAYSALKDNITRQVFFGDWQVFVLNVGEAEESVAPVTTGEKLAEIRECFGFSMATLADILNASRASLYNWFEQEPRSSDISQRIQALHAIANEWKERNPYHYAPSRLMKQKLGDQPSMLERLGHDPLDIDQIRSGFDGLLALMDKQKERMDRAKARSAKTQDSDSHKEILEQITGSVSADK